MEKYSFEEYLRYCSTWSLYARWQRYMSQDDNHEYNYFIDIWDNALITAEYMATENDYLMQLIDLTSVLPGGEDDKIISFYNIFFLHTILLVKGDKTIEKWILYWTELCNKQVKRINMGKDSFSEQYDLIPAIKKYKQVLIDINKGLVDIDCDLTTMYSDDVHLEMMNDKERTDLINQSIDILSDVDIDDVKVYVKYPGYGTITITKTDTETKTITDETETITQTKTDETITETGTDERITDAGTAENNETLLKRLMPIFYGDEKRAQDYIKKIKNTTNDVEKVQYTAQLVNENTISEMSCRRVLYRILLDHGLYNKTESNWNKVISQHLVKKINKQL